MANLRELADKLNEINRKIIEADGELKPEVEESLNATDGDFHRKVDYIRKVVLRLRAKASVHKAEKEAHAERQSALEKAADSWEEWVITNMERAGLRQAGRLIPQRIQTNGGNPSIRWVVIGEPIPGQFRKVQYVLDYDEALKYHKAGVLPKGFEVKRGRHLRNVSGESKRKPKPKPETSTDADE